MGLVHGFRGLVYVEGVSLSTHSASIQRQFQLDAIITPTNATNQNLVWTSSDTSIATVDSNGLVTPTGEGTVIITVTLDGYTDSCELDVELIHVTGITLDKNSITINAGEQEQLTATVSPSDASNPDIIWSSSNTAVAVVSQSGLVTYVGDGTCTITVTTVDGGYTATCSVECVSFTPVDCCFGYTGNQQSILLQPHEYKIEVWGAQGGFYTTNPSGKGGYAAGCINITSPTCLYIYVGGQGYSGYNGAVAAGGWNGGGQGYSYSSRYDGGGGGGTDVRIGGNTIYHRRIVAGGGGGGGTFSSYTMYGGAGGGANGTQGGSYSSTYTGGTGGTQTGGGSNSRTYCMVAGSFGCGGYKTSGASGYNGSGGGGGWYGGGAGSAVSSGGGGGSGYVYTSSTCSSAPSIYCHCTCYYFTGACCCCGLCSFPTAAGGTETGHTGCGCVRIRSL